MLIIAINAQSHSASTNEHHKSAITDHVCQNNHTMNWEVSEIVEQKCDKFKRRIKESICIRSNTPTMNRDEGAYQLTPAHMDTSDTLHSDLINLRIYRNN